MAKYQKQVNEENSIQEDATNVAVDENNVISLSEDFVIELSFFRNTFISFFDK